jgi:hypothetical protein
MSAPTDLPPLPSSDADPPLTLVSTIDADEIARLGPALADAIHGRLIAWRSHFQTRMKMPLLIKMATWASSFIRWFSAAGFLGSLALLYVDDLTIDGQPVALYATVFFGSLLLLSFPLWYFVRRTRTPWEPYWLFLSRMHARTMLMQAKRLAPFDACLVFDERSAAYTRVKNERAVPVWHRPLSGMRLAGPGFTLLYKNATAQVPHAILLHQPSAELDAWFDQQGVRPLPQLS